MPLSPIIKRKTPEPAPKPKRPVWGKKSKPRELPKKGKALSLVMSAYDDVVHKYRTLPSYVAEYPAKYTDLSREVARRADAYHRGGGYYVTPHYEGYLIDTVEDAEWLANELMQIEEYSFDTEFTSLRMQAKGIAHYVGCSFSWGEKHNFYVSVGHYFDDNLPLPEFQRIFKPVFDRTDVRVVGHNLKAELHALANIDLEMKTNDLFDTIVAFHHLYEEEEKSLKDITKNIYGYDQMKFKAILQTIPKPILNHYREEILAMDNKVTEGHIGLVKAHYSAVYAMDDTYWVWKIYLDIQDALEENGTEDYFYKLHMPYIKVLFNMERRGVKVDTDRLAEMTREATRELDKLEYTLLETAGVHFNIGSGEQIAMLLHGWKKKVPIYHEDIVETGEYYKAGAKKGQPKTKIIKNKDIIVDYRDSYVPELIEHSFNLPVASVTPTGMPQTGADQLEEMLKKTYKRDKRKQEGQEFVRILLRYKRLQKLKSSFMDGLLANLYPDGKAHCSFNITGTESGRLSCQNPNLQQLPRPIEDDGSVEAAFWKKFEIRSLFIPDDVENESIIAADFSNLEVRIATHFSRDPLLISMFNEGYDLHGDTAKNMFKLDCHSNDVKKHYPQYRQYAKTINFLLLYGGGVSALASQINVPRKEAQVIYDKYFETYQGMAQMMKDDKRFGHVHGVVMTILGRKRHLTGINSDDNGTRAYYERLTTNSKIQGSAADITIAAQNLIEDDPELKRLQYRQLLQVHDEIVGVAPDKNKEAAAKRVQYLMGTCLPEGLYGIELKADYDWGKSYAEAK